MVSSVKEYFQKDKKKNFQSQTTSTVQPTNSQSKPLAANELVRVGSWSITLDEFNERLSALKEVVPEFDANNIESKKLILEELVRQQLLVTDAKNRGVSDEKDIKAAIEEFERTLLVRELARQLTENIQVSDAEVRKLYDDNKDQLIQYRVSEIVVDDEIRANELRLDLVKGKDFAEVAKANSISASAEKGGDLGFVGETTPLQMVNQILQLKEGELSPVFETPEGFYIIKVVMIEDIPYDNVKEQIKTNQTLIKQQQVVLDYIEKLRQTIKVEVNEALLN